MTKKEVKNVVTEALGGIQGANSREI